MIETQIDGVNFLARSPTRVRLLKELTERGVVEKGDLRDSVDASRTTVQRNLDALEDRGLVRCRNRQYGLTRSGRHIFERFSQLLDTIYVTQKFKPFLDLLPPDSFDLDIHVLADADLTVAGESDPYAPVNSHIEFMRSVDHFRCLLPAVGLQPMEVALRDARDRDQTFEVIVDPAVAETIISDEKYGRVLSRLLALDGVTILTADTDVPYYLGLSDSAAQVGVGDEDGIPRCLVESTDPKVVDWGEETFGDYRTDAEPLTTTIARPKRA